MVAALFDTNILVDYLNGVEQAKSEIARFSDIAISQITWMEVMVGTTEVTNVRVRHFLASFTCIAVDSVVSEVAVTLRQKHKIKLPDAIIWASAHVHGRILVTRNTKDFNSDEPGIRIPYLL